MDGSNRDSTTQRIELYTYKGILYPDYLKRGNATRFITPVAKQFCLGTGIDVGCGQWPLEGALPWELKDGNDALTLPEGRYDYIYSSHCLEHLPDPIAALEHWRSRLREGGTLFLYLPHPDMEYWRPENCLKHRHIWEPERMEQILRALNFDPVIRSSGHDMEWSFVCVGFRAKDD